MIDPARPFLEDYASADIVTVHVEADVHPDRSLQMIRSAGKKAGVSLNPSTPASSIARMFDGVDLIMVRECEFGLWRPIVHSL